MGIKEKWFIVKRSGDHNKIARELSVHPLTAKLLLNRDLKDKDDMRRYLFGNREDLYDPRLMQDMDLAADIIAEKIEEECKIRVIGDYDIDGVMSTYILVDALKRIGAEVDYVIPHRVNDGYGLNMNLVEAALTDGVDTIITCDNGISAYSQIERAVDGGLTCIVTDHHDVPFEIAGDIKNYIIPPADAVIDPKIEGCGYPFEGICGAVVAMKLMQVLYETVGRQADEIIDRYIPMAGFATVGDVMELKDESRLIARLGLEGIKNTDNIGLNALISACKLDDKKITTYDIGFVLGPCINAAGRLDSADRAMELLLCRDKDRAVVLANDLKEYNDERKSQTQKAVENAISIVEDRGLSSRKVIVIYMPDIHESLSGLVAGKIKERYYKPTFVLSASMGTIKGSGRSIPTYSMYDELSKVKDLFIKFGGHPMAAGLSLQPENLDAFIDRIEEVCELSEEDFSKRVEIDAEMPFGYATMELISQFDMLQPFGNGNRSPLFARRNLGLIDHKVFGANRNVGRYTVSEDGKQKYELIKFGEQDEFIKLWEEKGSLNIAYSPELEEYNGERRIKYVIRNYS